MPFVKVRRNRISTLEYSSLPGFEYGVLFPVLFWWSIVCLPMSRQVSRCPDCLTTFTCVSLSPLSECTQVCVSSLFSARLSCPSCELFSVLLSVFSSCDWPFFVFKPVSFSLAIWVPLPVLTALFVYWPCLHQRPWTLDFVSVCICESTIVSGTPSILII